VFEHVVKEMSHVVVGKGVEDRPAVASRAYELVRAQQAERVRRGRLAHAGHCREIGDSELVDDGQRRDETKSTRVGERREEHGGALDGTGRRQRVTDRCNHVIGNRERRGANVGHGSHNICRAIQMSRRRPRRRRRYEDRDMGFGTRTNVRIAALWRGDPGAPASETRNHERLAPIFEALAEVGAAVEPVLYSDAVAAELMEPLSRFDGVLVWVDPLSGEGDRTVLDELLRAVAARGVWVSAHPDTITKIGTKEVLYRTRDLSWGADIRMYSTVDELRSRFPLSLATGQPRVLKPNRGNGGKGVWKVVPLDSNGTLVRVQHAAPRDDTTEDVTLDEFCTRLGTCLEGSGTLVDQPFAVRLAEGLIRAYLVEREVVGFARQQPTPRSIDASAPDPDRVLGMPSAKTMYDADEPEFESLRARLERKWVPELQRIVDLDDRALPVLWDADFLYGPRTERGGDAYMLCEINVSSVIPFPPAVPAKLAAAVTRRYAAH
jgi:uncharacterized protein DUF6815